jgi:hypothetical protein
MKDHSNNSCPSAIMSACLTVFSSILGLWPVSARAAEFHYHYVALDQIELPTGVAHFFPAALDKRGRVYGTACKEETCNIAFYKDKVLTVAGPGNVSVVNSGGTVGGYVVTDRQPFAYQAAVFYRNQLEPELIPPQPGEVYGDLLTLNDRNDALVESYDVTGSFIGHVFSGKPRRGEPRVATLLDFDLLTDGLIAHASFPSRNFTGKFLNKKGMLAGRCCGGAFESARAFRYDTRTRREEILAPLEGDRLAWGMGINKRGDVLGYSFVLSPYHENIGVWDRSGHFKTYFTETISSDGLVFNDNNLIVITLAPGDKSYLIPGPGGRVNLADLVEDMPAGRTLRWVYDINNHGDILGDGFLLERLDNN